jgi:hypothetical protein
MLIAVGGQWDGDSAGADIWLPLPLLGVQSRVPRFQHHLQPTQSEQIACSATLPAI